MTDTRPIKSIGFIHLVPFDPRDPRKGHEEGIELFTYAERLGLDSGWVRTRHLQHGLSAPAVFFGAVSRETERIGLGNAVIPVGFENPFRLAEDLATADVLSGGRLLPGLSVHPPRYDDHLNGLVHDAGWPHEDYGYGRIERLRGFLAGEALRARPEYGGFGGDFDSERVEPYSPGLSDRLWYGGGSLRSAEWAGRAGFHWLMSNINSYENGEQDFAAAQLAQIRAFRGAHAAGEDARVSVARVFAPTEGATAAQREKYAEYLRSRAPRSQGVFQGRTLIAQDITGSNDQIVDVIRNDAAFQAADDYLFELPFEFELDDWKQILDQLAGEIGPALGWRPAPRG
ncbi:LLM class flavin-dependent oxidoreductase [Microbacterium sp.]|uniref:LLM class flavin-dependent oxidoreductase n=1 Tax=Microbacterium sp. TaxID=51671 RepID=UPI003C71FC1E